MTASAEWGTFEYALIAGIPTVIGVAISGLISLSWGLFKQRLNETILRVNIHDSKIDNNRADIVGIKSEVATSAKFADRQNDEINQKLDSQAREARELRLELREDKRLLEEKFEILLNNLSTKIDAMNDRRNQPRGP